MTDLATALDTREVQLQDAAAEAFERARQKPTVANRRALKHAEKELDQFRQARLDDGGESIYRNIMEMVDALDADGWKISKSTAYEHRESGKLRLRSDGTITETMALGYARAHLDRKDGTPGAKTGNIQEEKAREEILRIRADRMQRELKYKEALGEIIPLSQVEIELAERASNLRTYLDAVGRSSAGRIIKLVEGDPQKAPELISFLLGMFRKAMDNYSRPIKGFEDQEEDD